MHENGFNDSANETSLQDLEQLPDAQSAELLAEFERRRRVNNFTFVKEFQHDLLTTIFIFRRDKFMFQLMIMKFELIYVLYLNLFVKIFYWKKNKVSI